MGNRISSTLWHIAISTSYQQFPRSSIAQEACTNILPAPPSYAPFLSNKIEMDIVRDKVYGHGLKNFKSHAGNHVFMLLLSRLVTPSLPIVWVARHGALVYWRYLDLPCSLPCLLLSLRMWPHFSMIEEGGL